MSITQEDINNTLCKMIPIPNGNVFSIEGFEVLAEWSEKQEWWNEFVKLNSLGHYWRRSYKSDPYWFALTLFRYVSPTSTSCAGLISNRNRGNLNEKFTKHCNKSSQLNFLKTVG